MFYMVTKELMIPYRAHTQDESYFIDSAFSRQHRTIWDIEKFWGQTSEAARSVAKKITEAGFLLCGGDHSTATYEEATYNTGLFSLIFPRETSEDIIQNSNHSSPHPLSLGELVYWKNEGFADEPITVRYDMNIDSPQNFKEVARLEKFLRNNDLPFQVTPTMDDVTRVIHISRRTIERAERYQIERNKAFQRD